MAFVGLDPGCRTPALGLAHGDQRRLEIARALAGDPAVLMTAGMNGRANAAIAQLIAMP